MVIAVVVNVLLCETVKLCDAETEASAITDAVTTRHWTDICSAAGGAEHRLWTLLLRQLAWTVARLSPLRTGGHLTWWLTWLLCSSFSLSVMSCVCEPTHLFVLLRVHNSLKHHINCQLTAAVYSRHVHSRNLSQQAPCRLRGCKNDLLHFLAECRTRQLNQV